MNVWAAVIAIVLLLAGAAVYVDRSAVAKVEGEIAVHAAKRQAEIARANARARIEALEDVGEIEREYASERDRLEAALSQSESDRKRAQADAEEARSTLVAAPAPETVTQIKLECSWDSPMPTLDRG